MRSSVGVPPLAEPIGLRSIRELLLMVGESVKDRGSIVGGDVSIPWDDGCSGGILIPLMR